MPSTISSQVAESLNVGWNNQKPVPRKPGQVYVLKGEHCAAGLPSIAEIDLTKWAGFVAWRKKPAATKAA